MFGALTRRLQDRDARKLVQAATRRPGQPPAPDVLDALDAAARALPRSLLGPRLRPLRLELCLIFARQAADASRRLGSSYWSSGGGRNVGHDVRDAHDRALRVLIQSLKQTPKQTPGAGLPEILAAHRNLMDAYRRSAPDPDGYGIATLGEIERDLEGLLA